MAVLSLFQSYLELSELIAECFESKLRTWPKIQPQLQSPLVHRIGVVRLVDHRSLRLIHTFMHLTPKGITHIFEYCVVSKLFKM